MQVKSIRSAIFAPLLRSAVLCFPAVFVAQEGTKSLCRFGRKTPAFSPLSILSLLLMGVLLSLAACGGGGGGGSTSCPNISLTTTNAGGSAGGYYQTGIYNSNQSASLTYDNMNNTFQAYGTIVDVTPECLASITSFPGGGSGTVAVFVGHNYVVQLNGGTIARLTVDNWTNGIITISYVYGLA